MTRTLSLHHLTAMDAGPREFVSIAAELGCKTIALFTCGDMAGPFLVTGDNEDDVAAQLNANGVAVHTVEYVALTPQMKWPQIEAGFARSARLNAKRMTVHCHDQEEGRALTNFTRICALAAEYGLEISLEWTAVNPAISTLGAATQFLDKAECANAGLAVDVLHLIRGGDTPADVKALRPSRTCYAQISDGPLRRSLNEYARTELMMERALPGQGELPIAEFVAALPEEIVIDVEVPQTAAKNQGLPALERCRRAVAEARHFVP